MADIWRGSCEGWVWRDWIAASQLFTAHQPLRPSRPRHGRSLCQIQGNSLLFISCFNASQPLI